MKKAISIMLAVLFTVLLSAEAFSEQTDSTLAFKDGKFRILVLSDTQDDHHPAPDMLNLVEQAIKETSPDLIVFTGDLVEDSRTGDLGKDDEPFREGVLVDGDHEKSLENTKAAAKAVLDIFEKSGVPFAIVQGNNDYKVTVTNEEWLAIYGEYSNSLAFDESDDAEGRIDYHLEIKGSDGSPKFNLWIMDTGKYGINDDQIEWYKKKSAELTENNSGAVIPAIEFQHIQPADVGNLFVECSPFDEGARAKGLKFYRLNPETAAGYNFFAYAPCEPTPLFRAWKEQGDVIGSYFGHQHIEGFTGTYDGIEMGFNYGAEMAKPGPYGYRLITLNEDDITNYENEMFKYEGSVNTGNAHFKKQIDTPYEDAGSLKYITGIGNFAWSMITVIIDLFISL